MFLVYAPRRVAYPACGVRVEAMAWVSGKSHLTQTDAWLLARWAQRRSWKEVAKVLVTPLCGVTRCGCCMLNGFRAKGRLSNGVVEGFNTETKLTSGKSFGFRTYHGAEIALYPVLGALPEPAFTHRFC